MLWAAVLCIVIYLAEVLPLPIRHQETPITNHDNQEKYQVLPNVPIGGVVVVGVWLFKIILVDNH